VVWEHVLPAFGGAGTDSADAALAARLARLRLPVRPAGPWPRGPDRRQGTGGAGGPEETTAAIVLTPASGTGQAQPVLRRVEIEGRTVTVEDEGGFRLGLELADGSWNVAESPVPAAVSGGWTGPGILIVDVAFLETPHRLSLTCSLRDGTFSADWRPRPLSSYDLSRLRSLAAPRDRGRPGTGRG
jgi:hypothetical protein